MRAPSPRGVLLLLRSRVVAVLLYSTGIASNMVALEGPRIDPRVLLLGTAVAFFATVSSYIFSDLMDLKEDLLNSPDRPLPSGRASREDAVFLIASGLAISTAISLIFFGYMVLIAVIASFALGSLYSTPGIRGKSVFWSKAMLSALGGFVGSFTGALILRDLTPFALALASINGMMIMLLVMIGDIIDYEGDRASGVRSLAVVFGKGTALNVMKAVTVSLLLVAVFAFRLRYPLISPLYPVAMILATSYILLSFQRLSRAGYERKAAKGVKQALRAFYFLVQALNVLSSLLI